MSKDIYKYFLALVLLVCFPTWGLADSKGSIVKIYTVHNSPDFYNPWSMEGPRASTGSGAVISGNRILTNAHVVSNSTFVQVRRYGESKKFQARVVNVSHDSDLALLELEDKSFFDGVKALEIGELPRIQKDVLVYGFPLGGDQLSITKGVVSRIEHQSYAHSSLGLLAVQIDAAINPGNSGGPVLAEGKIVGVVMQGMRFADGIGYLVPPPIIRHFLADIKDGKYDGFPTLGIAFQPLENSDLKKYHQVPDSQSGVLVTRVSPGTAASGLLEAGDVLISVDGHKVENDGSVEFRSDERTNMAFFVQSEQIGDSIDVKILRKGEEKSLTLKLTSDIASRHLVPMEQYDKLPSYFIYGGVVFTPLTKSLLKSYGPKWYSNAPKNLTSYLSSNYKEKKGEEVVLILKVLSSSLNEGYSGVSWWPVESVNGEEVLNLKDLVKKVESSESPYIVFKHEDGRELVLDRNRVQGESASILQTYRIRDDRSGDLKVGQN